MDWKKQYQELADMVSDLRTVRIIDIEQLHFRINQHISNSHSKDLLDQGKIKLLRIKNDITVDVVFNSGYGERKESRSFPSGTLIASETNGTIYLDEDNDGVIDFPKSELEEIIINLDDVDWDNVIQNG